LADLEQRIEELSWRVDRLARQVAQLSYKQKADDKQSTEGGAPERFKPVPSLARVRPVHGQSSGPPISTEISTGMAAIVRLIAHGDAEAAQRRLHKLPEEELARQPAVVALVAAALFVERGDFAAGLKAIARARQLTDDPRLVKLTTLIENQAST